MKIRMESFGKTKKNEGVYRFTMSNKNKVSVSVLNLGATIQSIVTPDKKGVFADIALGYSDARAYEENTQYVGAVIGRCANRIANAEIMLHGKTLWLTQNEKRAHLHGGHHGFDKKIWNVHNMDSGLCLTLHSPDGDEGYPGNLNVTVMYTLTDENQLVIDYAAQSDKDTLFSPTNYTFFNLGGHNSGLATGHTLKIYSENFTEIDEHLITTGQIMDVKATPMNFLEESVIGERVDDSYYQMRFAQGFDINYVISTEKKAQMKRAVDLYDPVTGRTMTLYTNMRGMQFDSGNRLNDEIPGKDNAKYNKYHGLCFAPQYFPNAINLKTFIPPYLSEGVPEYYKTIYEFGVR